MFDYTFHLIPNAHLDPVWLWDWRESLNEGLVTCRTILDLMDEDKELTFIRGESIIYEHIEQNDPETFKRIARYVKQGRWDIVGGTVIQPDTNLTGTETLVRHYVHGKRYFKEKFGVDVTAAWAADSFGHAEGLPEILAAAGMKGFAFTRPAQTIVPIAKSAFWWEGPGGSRVMGYRPPAGWYGCEREEMPKRLDELLKSAQGSDLHNVAVTFGLGNHGGGPTRRHIQEIRAWGKQHSQVKLLWSGLHRLFDALYKEVGQGRKLPVHRGELNFCLRGCYSSLAKYKYLYRNAEAHVARAERTDAVISAATARNAQGMTTAWDTVLFNSFHDILPGSSIERAFDDQIAWLGSSIHQAQKVELSALDALALNVDTTVAGPKENDMPAGAAMLVWNPHAHPYAGMIELEANLDWRPIWKYHKQPEKLPLKVTGPDGRPMVYQEILTEHSSMPDIAWRKRVVLPVNLPAMGWNSIEMAWVEGVKPLKISGGTKSGANEISNGSYRVRATVGGSAIKIFRHGKEVFGGKGLSAITVEDPWGSWGGMAEEPDSLDLSTVRRQWKVTKLEVLERGPLRSALWVRMEAGHSRMDLTFSVSKGRDAVDVSARLLWDERSARLKLVMPVGDRAQFDVPGGTVTRGPRGEVPGGRWVRVPGRFGFSSDALYNFDCKSGSLRATIVRASRYANDVKTGPREQLWRPAVDCGELKFRFLLSPGDEHLQHLAEELEQPPVALLVPAKKGRWGKAGSLVQLEPASLKVLAIKAAEDRNGYILRVQETSGKTVHPMLNWCGQKLKLSPVPSRTIATWRLTGAGRKWKISTVDATERPKRGE